MKKTLKFKKESNNNWYIDLPNWIGPHANLQMVCGADTALEIASKQYNTGDYVYMIASTNEEHDYDYKLVTRTEMGYGATYDSHELGVDQLWLCPVTLFVFGKYPKNFYIHFLTKEEYDALNK